MYSRTFIIIFLHRHLTLPHSQFIFVASRPGWRLEEHKAYLLWFTWLTPALFSGEKSPIALFFKKKKKKRRKISLMLMYLAWNNITDIVSGVVVTMCRLCSHGHWEPSGPCAWPCFPQLFRQRGSPAPRSPHFHCHTLHPHHPDQ